MKKGFIVFLLFFSILFFISCNETNKKNSYTVRFYVDGIVVDTQTVEEGAAAKNPDIPVKSNYVFTGWDQEFDNVLKDLDINALFVKEFYTVTYQIGDYVLYSETLRYNEKIQYHKYLSFGSINDDILNEALKEFKDQIGLLNKTNMAYEVNWLLNGVRIDENYLVQSDIILQAEIVTGFYLFKGLYIGGVVFSRKDIIEYPKEVLSILFANFVENKRLLLYDVSVEDNNSGILLDASINNNLLGAYRKFDIKEVIIPAELLVNGTCEYMFAKSTSIKKITINGDVSIIKKNTFYDLKNLESIIINGSVGKIEEDAINSCPRANLIINEE